MRPLQLHVAREMIKPQSGKNAVLQLNMGEGKSSVIVPMVATALADGKKLARVVVLKPLVVQMFHLLIQRVAGLANRRVFFFPFSRSVVVDGAGAQRLRDLFELCTRERGIWLAQPEHLLSFKLMGIDYSLASSPSSHLQSADCMLRTQRWLDETSRDILDESDEILSVKYQLVYTAGQRGPVENSPHRWLQIQRVLSLVKKHAHETCVLHPDGIEVQERDKAAFPLIRVLQAEAGSQLIDFIAHDIQDGDRLKVLSSDVRHAVLWFITSDDTITDQERSGLIDKHCRGSALWGDLLLWRGLLGLGLVLFALHDKRFRVDYGLDPSRTLLAVPYRAKDVPSIKADFGHPDVTIILTCLSYYYGGLTEAQVVLCFKLLCQLDNPTQEYEVRLIYRLISGTILIYVVVVG